MRSASPNLAANHTNRDSKASFTSNDDLASTSSNVNDSTTENLRSTATAKNVNKNKNEPTLDQMDLETFMKDWRHFDCTTWHLEPTVRYVNYYY